jgi:hypothetical protein
LLLEPSVPSDLLGVGCGSNEYDLDCFTQVVEVV